MNKTHFRVIDYIESPPEDTVVLIGTAEHGPVGVPFILTSEDSPIALLGNTALAKAYLEIENTGVSNVVLYRLNGTHSTASLSYRDEDDSLIDVLRFRSVSANDLYNSISEDGINPIKVDIDGTALIVTNSNETRRTYLLKEYPSASSLADALNIDAAYGLVEFETHPLIPDFEMSKFNEDAIFQAMFSGASTEKELMINRALEVDPQVIAELSSRVKVALFGEGAEDSLYEPNSTLGLMDFGGITLTDLFYEDDPNLAVLLGTFCQNKSNLSGFGCISVIGTTPVYNPTKANLDAKLTKLYAISPVMTYKGAGGLGGDTVKEVVGTLIPQNYVQVVVGDTKIAPNLLGLTEPISLAFGYLATLMSIHYYNNPTNKSLRRVTNLNYEFSKEVIDNLASNGYISIVSSIRRGFVPYLAITAVGSSSKSSFKKPHYVRIAQQISRILGDNLDDILGTTRQRTTRTDVQGRIRDLMQILVDSGAIRGYSVVCEFLNYNTELKVSVGFTPYSDVESVSSIVTLPIGQGVIV